MVHLHFLHGFLGLPRNWGPLALELKAQFTVQPQYHMHNLWQDLERLPQPSLVNWGLQFAQKIPPQGNILIGYSMGGRLAMHFPTWEQQKIAGIVLISAHTGLIEPAEKTQRGQSDIEWSRKFLTSPWEPLMQEWNAQPVFRFDRIRPPRKESEFSRPLLAKALEHWSLGTQDDMRLRLREFKCPIYYIHGDKDEKFAEVGNQLKARVPLAEVKAVTGGHSPHLSNPGDIVRHLKSFFNRIYREQVI